MAFDEEMTQRFREPCTREIDFTGKALKGFI